MLDQRVGEGLRVAHNLPAIVPERWLQGFLERHRFGGDDVLQRTTLRSWKHRLVDDLGVLLFAEDETASRTPQSLVGGARHRVGMGNG